MSASTIEHKRPSLGRKLASYRVLHDMTQEQVAEKVEVAPATISRIEQGVRRPSLDLLVRLARLFGVSMDELMETGAKAA